MNYDLAQHVYNTPIEHNIDKAMPYGDMPSSLLMSKFEETNLGSAEYDYDNYARSCIVDWREDSNKFEHEEPRGGISRSSGRLNLQYYGNRGNVDAMEVYRPEIFDGFGGPEDREHRVSTEPDMKDLRRQEDARMKFVRWDTCDDKSITGGGRSEGKTMEDQQTLFKTARDKLKVFSRTLYGRENYTMPRYSKKSLADKQTLTKCYVENSDLLTPQKRANIISEKIIRDTYEHRDETADTTFGSVYTQYRASGRTKTKPGACRDTVYNELPDQLGARQYKAAAILMERLVHMRTVKYSQHSTEYNDSDMAITSKSSPMRRDLSAVLGLTTHDANVGVSMDATYSKTPHLTPVTSLLNKQSTDIPAGPYLDAIMWYKSQKCRAGSQVPLAAVDAQWAGSTNCRTAKTAIRSAGYLPERYTRNTMDAPESETTHTYIYSVGHKKIKGAAVTSGEPYAKNSKMSQIRRPNHQNYTNPNTTDAENDIRFKNNEYKDRRGRPLGSKYTMRYIDTDTKPSFAP